MSSPGDNLLRHLLTVRRVPLFALWSHGTLRTGTHWTLRDEQTIVYLYASQRNV